MKVLITGATGFIGKTTLTWLCDQNIPVVVLGREAPKTSSTVTFVRTDLMTDTQLVDKLAKLKCTHLLHLAWNVDHGKFWHSEENMDWVAATCRLVHAFRIAGGKAAVFSGTCAEYGVSETTLFEGTDYGQPSTLYGVSKDATRRLVMSYCETNGVRCSWGRIFFPYGKGEDERRIVPSLFKAITGAAPAFSTYLSSRRDFIYIDDLVQGLWVLLQRGKHDIYNLCSGQETAIASLIESIADVVGKPAQVLLNCGKRESPDVKIIVGDNTKLRALGWSPVTSLHQGLQAIYTGSFLK